VYDPRDSAAGLFATLICPRGAFRPTVRASFGLTEPFDCEAESLTLIFRSFPMNTLYCDHNLKILREHNKDESVDLVFFEPTF
jgi:hypothetical protein